MIPVPSSVRVWLPTGHTDMRKGFSGLALVVQETVKRDPHKIHLFVFHVRRGDLIKVLWHVVQGAWRFSKKPEHSHFIRASPADNVVTVTPAQLGYPLEFIESRMPQKIWRPTATG